MRLTIRNSDGTVSQPMNLDWSAALEKLAAYEDTGLEPDEIKEKVGFMSPVCVGCDGKTEDGKRTEKCTYDEDFRKCLERSVHLSELSHAEEQGRLVPVVRCGECKHWKRIRNDCILASCELDALVRSEDFFCADGEMKDGDGE